MTDNLIKQVTAQMEMMTDAEREAVTTGFQITAAGNIAEVGTAAPEMVEILTRMVTDIAQRIGRSCGDCSLCCKIIDVEDPELHKPANQWCPHCKPGRGGCSIYDTRPALCRVWACRWLVDSDIPDYWRPTRSKMVINIISPEDQMVYVNVDPGYPDIWRSEPYYSDLKRSSLIGLTRKPARGYQVMVGQRTWRILPNKDVLLSRRDVVTVVSQVGQQTWELAEMPDQQTAQNVIDRVDAIGKYHYDLRQQNPFYYDTVIAPKIRQQMAQPESSPE